MQSLFGPHNHNMESPLCYNANLDTFLTTDVYFFFLY